MLTRAVALAFFTDLIGHSLTGWLDNISNIQWSRNPPPVLKLCATLDLSNPVGEESLEAIALMLDCTKDCLAVNKVVTQLNLDSAMLLKIFI